MKNDDLIGRPPRSLGKQIARLHRLSAQPTPPAPVRREIDLTCRVNGVEVSLEELAQELVRCGGIVAKKGSNR
jgi:hypothetical protein